MPDIYLFFSLEIRNACHWATVGAASTGDDSCSEYLHIQIIADDKNAEATIHVPAEGSLFSGKQHSKAPWSLQYVC